MINYYDISYKFQFNDTLPNHVKLNIFFYAILPYFIVQCSQLNSEPPSKEILILYCYRSSLFAIVFTVHLSSY